MNPILQGLQEGYGEEEILSFLSKAIPKLGNTIKKASKSGYGTREILGFLSKNFETESLRGKSESQIHGINQRADAERAKYGLKVAASAVAAPLAASAARSALSRALPNGLKNVPGQLLSGGASLQAQPSAAGISNPSSEVLSASVGNNPLGNTQPQSPMQSQQQNVSQQPPANPVAANIAQPPNLQQPKGNTDKLWTSILNGKLTDRDPNVSAFMKVTNNLRKTSGLTSKEQFDKLHQAFENKRQMGLEGPELARELFAEWEGIKNGETAQQQPESNELVEKPKEQTISGAFGEMGKGVSENLYKGLFDALQKGKDTFSGIKDPILAKAKPAYDRGEIKSPEDLRDFVNKSKIEKNATVASPKGVGEVKEIRNGKALIDIDGKLHKVNEDELEGEPEDIAELYDNLFNAIPDEFKSRMMNYAGYDEDSNELLFRPHGGAAYVYKDIPEEFATQLKNRLHKAKTTGKNMYGMWNEGDQSYGAGMSALIKELQGVYGGKGKEYVRKYNTLFDILGVPHEAKKRKEEEKRRKRKGIS